MRFELLVLVFLGGGGPAVDRAIDGWLDYI